MLLIVKESLWFSLPVKMLFISLRRVTQGIRYTLIYLKIIKGCDFSSSVGVCIWLIYYCFFTNYPLLNVSYYKEKERKAKTELVINRHLMCIYLHLDYIRDTPFRAFGTKRGYLSLYSLEKDSAPTPLPCLG